jgi:hypothetical protein
LPCVFRSSFTSLTHPYPPRPPIHPFLGFRPFPSFPQAAEAAAARARGTAELCFEALLHIPDGFSAPRAAVAAVSTQVVVHTRVAGAAADKSKLVVECIQMDAERLSYAHAHALCFFGDVWCLDLFGLIA